MEDESETLLRDLQRYRFLLHNFPQDQRLARALLRLIGETELRLRELGVEHIPR
ncbi:MAG TPA: hypothetical protein VET84_00715 [Stellaceae bacterium]|nr:hypothetical protein [Stellaceae bacterium]